MATRPVRSVYALDPSFVALTTCKLVKANPDGMSCFNQLRCLANNTYMTPAGQEFQALGAS